MSLWKAIAPTVDDWEAKLVEVPEATAHDLAIELLREGHFTCVTPLPARRCVKPPLDVPAPAETATLDDPCLRRMLALWAIGQVEPDDIAGLRDPLRAIAAIPPPESLLVSTALKAVPEADQELRMELLAVAWKAGQHDVVNASLGPLDEAHLVIAARDLHFGGAVDALSAEAYRAVYLHAAADEQLETTARQQAIVELAATTADDKLPSDVRTALVTAAKSADCAVAASAARALDKHGEHRFVPGHKLGGAPMRAMCVLASFEQLQRADETSLLRDWVPARGLELVRVSYDPYSDADPDGDGDVHTSRTIELVRRTEVTIPEIDDLVRALRHCTGSVCRSDDHEFRFGFANGLLARLEVVELPPCP